MAAMHLKLDGVGRCLPSSEPPACRSPGPTPSSGHSAVVFRPWYWGALRRLRRRRKKEETKNANQRPENATDGPHIRSALKPRLSRASPAQPMIRVQEQEHLAQADWHITEVKTHIVRHRVKVKHALDTGQPSELMESMLHAFEASLRAFEKHRELVLNHLKRRLSE
jgi:hypothetical protein